MPDQNGQELSPLDAILAEMKAIKRGLSGKLDEVVKKVDGVAQNVDTLRRDCMKLYEAVLAQEIALARTNERVEVLEAEVVLLKRGSNGSAAASPESSRAAG